MRSESRQRSQIVAVRVTDDEKARYAEFAARKGMTLPEFMRIACDAVLIDEWRRAGDRREVSA